jgi:hypothetical protein
MGRRFRNVAGWLLVVVAASGCARLTPYRTPEGIAEWQSPDPPRLSLADKTRTYQERVELLHLMPDGMLRYRFDRFRQGPADRGNQADGPHFQGMYLASQALRWAATGEPEALEQVRLALRGARLFAEVSGVRGLLARWYAPGPPPDQPHWHPSLTHPGYAWRSDVSKDQYAGFVHGLGTTLALVSDAEIRADVADLAGTIADHLIEHDLEITDEGGERTEHGDLRGRFLGVPLGVNALISLAVAKTAALATHEPRHQAFYERLVAEGYPEISYWAHFSVGGIGNRVNDHMAHLALYPLLLLERDEAVAASLRRGARRSWRHVSLDRNAFFAFVYAGVVAADAEQAAAQGRQALHEFPDRKIGWPVDLTRPGFDLPRACLNESNGLPRSARAVPVYLRPMGASLWSGDPRRMVGRLRDHGQNEYSGVDYLLAYWMGRYHGLVPPGE